MFLWIYMFDFLLASSQPPTKSDRWKRSTARAAVHLDSSKVSAESNVLSTDALERQQKLLALREKLTQKADYLLGQTIQVTDSGGQHYLTLSDCDNLAKALNSRVASLIEQQKALEDLKASFIVRAQREIDKNITFFPGARRHEALRKIIADTVVSYGRVSSENLGREVSFTGSGAAAEWLNKLKTIQLTLSNFHSEGGVVTQKDELKKVNLELNAGITFLRALKTSLFRSLKQIAFYKYTIQNACMACEEIDTFFTQVLLKKETYDKSYFDVIQAAKKKQTAAETENLTRKMQVAEEYGNNISPFVQTEEELAASPPRRRSSSVVSFAVSESRVSSSAPDDFLGMTEEEMQAHMEDQEGAALTDPPGNLQ